MRDMKSLHSLATDEHWPFIGSVVVEADSPAAMQIPVGASQQQAEEIVQTWQKVAVLRVSPHIDVMFGFQAGDHMQFLNTPVETDGGVFGARLGDGAVRFFVIPVDMKSRPVLELVTITNIDDPQYTNLPIY